MSTLKTQILTKQEVDIITKTIARAMTSVQLDPELQLNEALEEALQFTAPITAHLYTELFNVKLDEYNVHRIRGLILTDMAIDFKDSVK